MRVVVVGAGLGGLAAALRLQGAGRRRDASSSSATRPGRARLPAARRRLHVGHGPVAADDAVGARGDVRGRRARPARRADAAPARPALPDPLGGRGRALRLRRRPGAAARRDGEVLARATPRGSSRSSPRCAPIYERGDPRRRAARVPVAARLRAARARRWCGSTRCARCTRFVARYFEHPRVREAFSFHSLFIGGDPYRVPAIYGALVYLQVLDGGWYADGGVYARGRGDGAAARRALRRAGRARSSTRAGA